MRRTARRVNDVRQLATSVALLRRALPGDPDFGDPLSTDGTEPVQVAARRAYQLADGRLSLLGQMGLAVLQVADWLQDGARTQSTEVAIAFTDLVGFSEWAVEIGDEPALELLRRINVIMDATAEVRGGQVVKRLGDGTMAVFESPDAAVEATREALEEVAGMRADGYEPQLRAGVHFGEPTRIGGDYIGVDVTVAARLCESAGASEILISNDVADRLDRASPVAEWEPGPPVEKGTPEHLRVFRVGP
jgi:adenylate cyclase